MASKMERFKLERWFQQNKRLLLQSVFLSILFFLADIISHLISDETHHSPSYFLVLVALCIVYFKLNSFFLKKSQREIDQLNKTLITMRDTDQMTGLPTRVQLEAQIQHHKGIAERHRQLVGVIVVDIDHLRIINQELGMEIGDQTIRMISDRIHRNIRAADFMARIAGDQLAITMVLEHVDQALFMVDKLSGLLDAPVSVDGVSFDVDVTFGLALYPTHSTSPESLVRHALEALSYAKRNHDSFGVFNKEIEQLGKRRLTLFSELKQAIQQQQLRLFYQPQFSLETGQIISAEALIRWPNELGSSRSPAEFISLAEQTRLLKPFTELVIHQAVQQLALWRNTLPIPVSINLSAGVLLDRSLVPLIERTLRAARVVPNQLVLEVTESMLMAHPARCLETLRMLKELGCELSLDDFGTGYTSLAYLRQMPVRELKIDRSFVSSITDAKSRSIIRMILQLADELGIRTVAEGIETQNDYDQLAEWGCQVGQGFLVSPALPPETFIEFVQDYHVQISSRKTKSAPRI